MGYVLKQRLHDVSIHARHCWRANPARQRAARTAQTVSIHARHCWRANRAAANCAACFGLVSIHARHCWRANPAFSQSERSSAMFQSTPAIAGGRIKVAGAFAVFVNRFQATPAIAGGRIRGAHLDSSAVHCFNPRPPLLAGESPVDNHHRHSQCVSIHARHCWRANPASW